MTRMFEIIPGALSWTILLTLLLLSWKLPLFVSVFIILFDLYWFLKTLYLFFHLRFSFSRMWANMKIDWQKKLNTEKLEWEKIHHFIVLPMYKEPYEVVRETFENLLEVNYPKSKMFVLLATEHASGLEAMETVRKIKEEFGHKFKGFLATAHIVNPETEIPGKGSNEAYAVRVAMKEMIEPSGIHIENILVSVFDVDTLAGPEYFGILTHTFLTAPHPHRSSYQPIPIFTKNIYDVPIVVRLISFSCTFWQLMQQARPEQLVSFSSHSVPLKELVEIGYWRTTIVSEDSQIFYQFFNHYNGDWHVVPLFYPTYMDAVIGNTMWEAMKNLYKQQRRWAWGIENFVYTMSCFVKNKKIAVKKKAYWTFKLVDGFTSWATSSFIIFFFGVMPNIIGGAEFHTSVTSYNLPKLTGLIVKLSTFGIITSAFLSIVLLPQHPRVGKLKWYYVFYYLAQWALIPVAFIFFSAVPALEAQTRMLLGGKFKLGFWVTPKTARKK
ncbi:MAG: glycosyltransferase family 2 protein [Patescibacteria group bacterium]